MRSLYQLLSFLWGPSRRRLHDKALQMPPSAPSLLEDAEFALGTGRP
eukprot:CAMPEP_0170576760 /NCGR_PEP_ID=MMETSP0224-20130122/4563_1 /TAXON_ID=285029 /ORGANISM="Togula jolla, Strain CCCM 725" /LENGTH=46 /DNA_ID= /DNA_START= /DNA_END= /DNA_ORIENTATION=